VWWMGHGQGRGGLVRFILNNVDGEEEIYDWELASIIDQVQLYQQRTFSFMTCFSGGILDDLQGPKSIVLTSSSPNQTSAADKFCDSYHAEYNYFATASFHWQTPCLQCGDFDADSNDNGLVSFEETFQSAVSNVKHSQPQKSDIGGMAPRTYLRGWTTAVSPDGSGDYPTIQSAVDAAQENDIIALTDGTFTGTGNRDIDFRGKAISIVSQEGADNCIIDCQGQGRGFVFRSGEGADSEVGGITITNADPSDIGGGVFCESSSPTTRSCTIKGNQAYRGGGVLCNFSSAVITDCMITSNTASGGEGGGIAIDAESNVTIRRCSITDNYSEESGGGIFASGQSSTTISSCTLSNNCSDGSGGGIFNGEDCQTAVSNTILWGNDADDFGTEAYLEFGSSTSFECCDVFLPGVAGPGISEWLDGNIFTDPMFCGTQNQSRPYTINFRSPCADHNNPYCSRIGSWPVGCGRVQCKVPNRLWQ
jgi:parallel beta-helix repeat protein